MTQTEKIDKIYDIVISLDPVVKNHQKTLYGNGRKGLKDDVLLLKNNQQNCPARKSVSNEAKRLNVSYVMMAIAIVVAVISIFK